MGIAKETACSSLNNIIYVLYPDKENLFEQKLNIIELFYKTDDDTLRVVGHKDKKEFKLWLMKNKMLNGYLPFVSIEQYNKTRRD